MKRSIILTFMLLLLCGCAGVNASKEEDVSNNSEVKKVHKEKAPELNPGEIEVGGNADVVIDYFIDPVCLACSQYNDSIKTLLRKKINSKEVKIKFHIVSYLNDKSPDDYSNRAGAYILAVNEYAPEKVFTFINLILNHNFRPDTPASEGTPDSKFINAMQQAKLTSKEIEKVESNKENFVFDVLASTQEFMRDDSLWLKFSPTDKLYTPYVLVNKKGSLENKALPIKGDLVKELENAINEISIINKTSQEREIK